MGYVYGRVYTCLDWGYMLHLFLKVAMIWWVDRLSECPNQNLKLKHKHTAQSNSEVRYQESLLEDDAMHCFCGPNLFEKETKILCIIPQRETRFCFSKYAHIFQQGAVMSRPCWCKVDRTCTSVPSIRPGIWGAEKCSVWSRIEWRFTERVRALKTEIPGN